MRGHSSTKKITPSSQVQWAGGAKIQTLKSMVVKSCSDGKDLSWVLLNNRATQTFEARSPTEFWMSRKLRTFILTLPQTLKALYSTVAHRQLLKHEVRSRSIEITPVVHFQHWRSTNQSGWSTGIHGKKAVVTQVGPHQGATPCKPRMEQNMCVTVLTQGNVLKEWVMSPTLQKTTPWMKLDQPQRCANCKWWWCYTSQPTKWSPAWFNLRDPCCERRTSSDQVSGLNIVIVFGPHILVSRKKKMAVLFMIASAPYTCFCKI